MKVCIVSSCGGHLTEVRALKRAYGEYEHFYVLNDKALLPPDMEGKTYFITHAERDWRVLKNFWEALRILRGERPAVILSTGAGPVVPFAIVGGLLFGIRIVFVETFTRVERPSLTARIMYWVAHDFFYQREQLAPFLPARQVRWGVAVSTFVSVGNPHQPFLRLLEAVEAIAPLLPQPVIVQRGHTPFRSQVCIVEPFFEMAEFERLVNEADVVISHAGGGGVLLAVQSGKVPVLMARRACHGEHVDDHQVENARELASSGKAVVAESANDLIDAVEAARTRQLTAQAADTVPPLVAMVGEVLRGYAGILRK